MSEYQDGLGELETISASIEDLIDSAHMRGIVYLESENCDFGTTDTIILDDDDESTYDDVRLNALINIIQDLLKDRKGYKMIEIIFQTVYNAIFNMDEEDECGDDEELLEEE